MRKLFQFIKDFWEAIGAFAGAAIMVYEFVAQLYSGKNPAPNNAVWIGLALFVFFGILELIKANKNASEAQKKYEALISETNKNASKNSMTVGTQSAGRDSYNVSGDGVVINPHNELPTPNLVLKISDDNQVPSQAITLHLNPTPTKPDIENIVSKERKKLFDELEISKLKNTENSRYFWLNGIASFPDRAEEYLKKYTIYLNDVYINSILEDRFRKLWLMLENQGVRPATNVVLKLEFPRDFPFPPKFVSHLEFMNNLTYETKSGETFKEKYKVSPPEKPDVLSIAFPVTRNPLDPGDYYSSRSEKVDTGHLKLSKENVARFDITSLTHNLPYNNFPYIFMWLGNITQGISWRISYKIYADEIPNSPIEGTIEIKVAINR